MQRPARAAEAVSALSSSIVSRKVMRKRSGYGAGVEGVARENLGVARVKTTSKGTQGFAR